jgi:hypothetical protein
LPLQNLLTSEKTRKNHKTAISRVHVSRASIKPSTEKRFPS